MDGLGIIPATLCQSVCQLLRLGQDLHYPDVGAGCQALHVLTRSVHHHGPSFLHRRRVVRAYAIAQLMGPPVPGQAAAQAQGIKLG